MQSEQKKPLFIRYFIVKVATASKGIQTRFYNNRGSTNKLFTKNLDQDKGHEFHSKQLRILKHTNIPKRDQVSGEREHLLFACNTHRDNKKDKY